MPMTGAGAGTGRTGGSHTGGVPVLTDGVVTLREHRTTDIPRLVEQCTDPDMVRWTTIPHPYGEADAVGFLDEVWQGWQQDPATTLGWAIEVADGPDPHAYAGTIDLRPRGDGTAGLGYALHPDARGRGHMARALRLVVDHAFDVLALTGLHWEALVGHWASRRIAWSCGFRMEGVRRLGVPQRGRPVDVWQGSLLRDEPRSPTTSWFVPPVLDGSRVRLRPFRADDEVPEGQDEASARFLGHAIPVRASYPGWLHQVREAMAAGVDMYWCIADPVTDAVLGGIHVFRLGDAHRPGGRLGYWLVPSARHRGIATEAAQIVVRYALAEAAGPPAARFDPPRGGLRLPRVGADADVANSASIAVLRAAGFELVGTHHRDVRYPDGAMADMAEFELLP